MSAVTQGSGRHENGDNPSTWAEYKNFGRNVLARALADLVQTHPQILPEVQKALKEADSNAVSGKDGMPQYMIGSSPVMRHVYGMIRKFGVTDIPVLITGETGTGKELVARAIHERSNRAEKPFIAINCAAMQSALIGSELFGHEKGAFTGAHQKKIGQIERANGGTIFLDEIGDLPADTQGYLLRFLQEGTIDRLGGRSPIPVDVRVLAATNVDLEEAIAEGSFREDLLFRLNGLTLNLPPLRERGDDVLEIATFFLKKITLEMDKDVESFAPDAKAALKAYAWPGNVREVISVVRRAVLLCEDSRLSADALGLGTGKSLADRRISFPRPSAGRPTASAHRQRRRFDAKTVADTLEACGDNVSEASRALNVSRVTFYKLMKEHGISRA